MIKRNKLKSFGSLMIMTSIFMNFVASPNDIYAQEPNSSLEWSIKTDKAAFYPGEPIPLIFDIKNIGTKQEEVDFGMDGIEAFSMEIQKVGGVTMARREKIQRFGLTLNSSSLLVPLDEISQKTIVLNQWCSTLLPAGQYHIICNVEYRLHSEYQKQPDTVVIKAGPIHKLQLKLDIQIIGIDRQKFKEIIKNLTNESLNEIKREAQNMKELCAKRETARDMLAFAETDLAVQYQLELLKTEKYTWRKLDVINSLVKSGTLEAANGLVQIIEDPNVPKEDIKAQLINGVYRLRDKGMPEIINATNDFVAKYQRKDSID